MLTRIVLFIQCILISALTYAQTNPVIAGFNTPDTVCVNTPVNITNTSSGATSYYWNFCTGNLNTPPTGINMGNIGGVMTSPVYIDYVQDNGNYYGFVTDNYTGSLFRLDFGTSLLNTPTMNNLGTLGGMVPPNAEGIQIIKNEGQWYAIIVGGDPVGGNPSRIIKAEFGANITNNSPVVTNWGNLGNLNYPHDLYVFSDANGIWYGLTVNTGNNTITRFNFTNSFSNTPTALNLGNIGSLSGPTGLHAINDNGNWYAFITNATSSTLTRLDFGNSLLNTPTGQNLGNVGGLFHTCWDIYIIKYCGDLLGYVINANTSYNNILKLNFNNNITSTPIATDFGNIGNLNFPHCLSKIFRAGPDLYTFIPNVSNQTISRLSFAGCNNSSIPNSTSQNPGAVTYNTPGTYNINLTLDDGLATQTAYCRQVVVLPSLTHTSTQTVNICTGDSVKIGTGVKYGKYTWNTGATTDSIIVKTNGTYWVQIDRFGCSNRDSFTVNNIATPIVQLGADTAVCLPVNFVVNAGNTGASYQWQDGSANQTFTVTSQGKYYVKVTNSNSCTSSDTINVSINTNCNKVTAAFVTPDTVCLNTPVTINNTSSSATSYYWNFCVADINAAPVGVNLGNPGNFLNGPVFMDYAYTNNNYYGFVTNYNSGNLIRLDFGNSLLNTPVATNLGNYGGILQTANGTEGVQVVQNEGKWYVFVVGGTPVGGTQPRLVKIELGTNITNPGVATNYGNLGNMNQPIDLHIFNENGNWYGFTVNAENNTITRFDFTNSFNNTPTAVNLGNIGALAYPTGIYAVNDNGFWRVFIVNGGDNQRIGTNSSITRLDFGTSLLNTPTGVNLGNPGGQLHHPRDFTIMKFCGQIIGFAVNGNPSYNNIVRLNFNNDLTSAPTITTVGNIGNLNFPHSISKLFRVNDNVYTFITNVANNTITRLQFQGCTNASVSSSTLQNPAPVTYTTPGTYNINLTVDDGLPTQTSFCRQVVVLAPPTHTPTQTVNICTGDSLKIGTGVKYAKYTWNTGATSDSIIVKTNGTYFVQTDLYGCTNKDSFGVNNIAKPVVNLGADTSVCQFTNYVLDAGNTGATYLWQDGSTNQKFTVTTYGKYYVKVTNNNGCVNSDTIIVSVLGTVADFHYKQDVCNPLAVQFFSDGNSLTNPYWAFGDGNTSAGNLNPVYTYSAFGNYTVKFGIQSGNCKDTIIKIIPVNVANSNMIITPDTTICINATKQLRTLPALSFCWSPATWLDNPNSPNPVTSAPRSITYYFTAEVPGNNLIPNGDFSNGNTGFTSEYNFANPNITEGQYFVGTNPQTWNAAMSSCHDHTTGSGNMLLVNGSPIANVKVWTTTVTVTPNTNYAFSTWIQALWPPNPAQLNFSINGKDIGNLITASLPTCTWSQFYTTWNSGNNTTATISVVNKNTAVQGNDFALDDISFAPVLIQRDSVIISVDTPLVKTNNDTTICTNSIVQLHATGADIWSWSPATGLSNAAISNPTATITSNTQYIVTGINQYGCIAKDTVDISLYPVPAVLADHHMLVCPNTPVQLSANSAFASYSWSPAATLSNAAIANPVASPLKTTMYTVQVTDANNCNYSDSIDVAVHNLHFAASFNQEICRGSSITLQAKGGDTYLWNPAGSLDDATSATPVATPDTSTVYSVHISDDFCKRDTTMNVSIKVKPSPNVLAEKTNDINCASPNAKLSASGAISYLWFPATGLDNPNIANPVAGADSTTTYYVQGTNEYGCSDTANVTVYVTVEGKVSFVVPNAFTPNGDGRNDCFGVKSWGGAVIEEFSIFNRWGQKVFTSGNTTQCWDGRYNGTPCDAGGYVYVIKAKTICGTIKRTGVVMLIR